MVASNGVRGVRESAGGRDIAFSVYPYEDHARLVVTLRHHKPLVGRDLVLGSLRLDIGREDLAGLTSRLAVRLVAVSILNALSEDLDTIPTAAGHGAPLGATGGTVAQDSLPGL
jgi:hypothetical protein